MNLNPLCSTSTSQPGIARASVATRPDKLVLLIFGLLVSGLLFNVDASADEGDSPSFSYLLHCAGCHLEDGAGDPPEIPDLRQEFGLLLATPKGRQYSLRVPGVADTPVAAEEMAALMTWMVSRLFPDREDFKPFTAEEVIAGRNNRLQDPARYRKELLLEISTAATAEQH